MTSKRALERLLATVSGFSDPKVELEQYQTSPTLAADIIHLADLHDDITGHTVIDLGTGTGIIALGAAIRTPTHTIGIDCDPTALTTARKNEHAFELDTQIHWVLGTVPRLPLCAQDSTVLMNPPFGAQKTTDQGDRAFLDIAAKIAGVSYSIHNKGSQGFVEAFAADNGGTVTHRFESEIQVARQFEFHTTDSAVIPVEVYRIEWDHDP